MNRFAILEQDGSVPYSTQGETHVWKKSKDRESRKQ